MSSRPEPQDEGRSLAHDILTAQKNDIISRIPAEQSPPAPFYEFLKQNRKRFYATYIDAIARAVMTGDTTDFLGNETFQSYSHARNGFALKEVLSVPTAVKTAVLDVLSQMVDSGAVSGRGAYSAFTVIDWLLDQAQTIRAQAFIQTRDEAVAFFHDHQVEIDRFPTSLASMLDFETLMGSAIKKCIELVGAGRVAFFSRDLAVDEMCLIASNFDHERIFPDGSFTLDGSIYEGLIRERRPVVIEGHRRSTPLLTAVMKRMKSKVVLLVPLMVRDRNAGIMLADNIEAPQMFTPEVASLALRFCNRVAGAMENARLHGSEQRKLKETMALLEASRLVSSTLDIDMLLSGLVRIAVDICGVPKCSVYIYIKEDARFFPMATFATLPDSDWEVELVAGVEVEEMDPADVKALMEERRVVVMEPGLSPFVPMERSGAAGVRSVVLVPLYSRERFLGMIILFHPDEADELEPEDLNLITAIAGQAAMALENATLYEDLEMSYFSTVKALARAIEVKDPYTYGHSERVTEYALAIARRMDVSENEIKNIKYAAALHDIGKIGIARKILDKPGTLSDEEFVYIKTHPRLGDSIIEPVAFLEAPRNIILHHHERFDGQGYPDGLRGDEIELGARILAVADAFQAMMSDRPYRKSLHLEEALGELESNSGGQFDPRVVRAFIEAHREGDIACVRDGAAGPGSPMHDSGRG